MHGARRPPSPTSCDPRPKILEPGRGCLQLREPLGTPWGRMTPRVMFLWAGRGAGRGSELCPCCCSSPAGFLQRVPQICLALSSSGFGCPHALRSPHCGAVPVAVPSPSPRALQRGLPPPGCSGEPPFPHPVSPQPRGVGVSLSPFLTRAPRSVPAARPSASASTGTARPTTGSTSCSTPWTTPTTP